jgi:hypothetical protein
MRLFTFAIIVFAFFASCSQPKNKSVNAPIDTGQKLFVRPNVKVDIALEKDTVASSMTMDLSIIIKLTNSISSAQEIIFDKLIASTGTPWGVSAKVLDIKTGKSVLQYENIAIMESRAYSKEDLKDKYTQLPAGGFIEKKYKLTNIVAYGTPNYNLPKPDGLLPGIYTLQLFYFDNASNIVTITVQ